MILGGNMQLTGRDWSVACIGRRASAEIYATKRAGTAGRASGVTEKKLSKFVDGFLAQVDAAAPPEKWEAVEEEVAVDEPAAAAGGGEGGAAAAAEAAATREKDLRKAIGAMEMNFNSGRRQPQEGAGRAARRAAAVGGQGAGDDEHRAEPRDEAQEGRPDAEARGRWTRRGRRRRTRSSSVVEKTAYLATLSLSRL